MTSKGPINLDSQLKDIRKHLSDQLGCLEFRMDSKLSLLQEYQEFFRRRGEVEYEYARSIERLCEKFERNTKQRNIRNELRSTFNLWSTLLAETRKTSRERATLAEILASEMVARLEVMAKDVQVLTKKCKEMCVEVQDNLLKEIRDLSEQSKVYQHSCHNTNEAYNKLAKSKEKVDASKGARRKKAVEKDLERQRQYKAQKHLLMKNRNDYILGVSRCNALAMQYFNMDVLDIIEYMDYDYHDSYRRLMCSVRDAEYETCSAVKVSVDSMVEQAKTLNFEGDLHYFLSEYSTPFTPPTPFVFTPFQGDDVQEYKVNTEDVFKRAKKGVQDLQEEVQTLQMQREEDVKTIQHMKNVNLKKYQVTSVDDALAVIEENGDSMPAEASRGTASLERGLSLSSRASHALQLSQKGKKDTVFFTLGIVHRRVQRADRLSLASAQLDILEKALDEQKVPPVPVGVDAQGRQIPGEVPKLFGGDIVEYINATGNEVPLIVRSCVKAIEQYGGMRMEGLFRVPGPAAFTDELRKGFEEGRDPLAYAQNKPDICAIASTLKAYFRELSIPLFPTDKYRDFINCTRHAAVQDRLDSIQQTVNTLPPAVISVMKYLFRFLSRVAQHSSENKMGTANLALVFGPTLMRAPDAIDPRQLHTDVPSVNVLIQLCIEQNPLIFGDEDEEEEDEATLRIEQQSRSKSPPALAPEPPSNDLEASFELNSKVTVLSTSPPTEPAFPPSSLVPQPRKSVSDDVPRAEETRLIGDVPPPPLPPRTSMIETTEGGILIPPDNEPPPPRPPKSGSSPPPEEPATQEEPTPPTIVESPPPEESVPVKVPTPPREEPQPVEESELPQKSTTGEAPTQSESIDPGSKIVEALADEFSDLDKTMEEINDSLVGMEDVEVPKSTNVGSADDELSDDDTDSEDDDVVKAVQAHALYDYTGRNDKELSFKRGDILQVIEKTPDHNWWDGFHNGKRGFIPVAYIEIPELAPLSAPSDPPSALVPTPPQRKSSMPAGESESTSSPKKQISTQPSIPEDEVVNEERAQILTPELVVQSPSQTEPPPTAGGAVQILTPSVPVSTTTQESVSEPSAPAAEIKSTKETASVRALSQQFQEPPPQQKVLVEPHSTSAHRRQRSTDFAASKGTEPSDIPRSSSTGNSKVGKMASVFESKAAPQPTAPPLISPKPKVRPPAPGPPTAAHSTHSDQQPPTFPLMSHPPAGGVTGVSPLQRAAHQGQQKPAAPAPQLKAGGKVKREKSVKGKSADKTKPSVPEKGKPPTAAKPPAFGGGPGSKELKAELAAKLARK